MRNIDEWHTRNFSSLPFIYLNCSRTSAKGDFEGVDVEPCANVEDQLLGERVAKFEGSTDEASHFFCPVRQLLIQLLRVGLLEGEQVRPGLRVGVTEVEAAEDGHHVVQGVRVDGIDPAP